MKETLANYLAGMKVELTALAKAGADPRGSASGSRREAQKLLTLWRYRWISY